MKSSIGYGTVSSVGFLYGLWLFFFDLVEATIFGVNVYVMRNILMMDFVRHTHLKVSFGRVLNAVVICPHFHQLHHSTDPKHLNRNFGLMFAVWDRLFGNAECAESERKLQLRSGRSERRIPFRDGTLSFAIASRRHADRIALRLEAGDLRCQEIDLAQDGDRPGRRPLP